MTTPNIGVGIPINPTPSPSPEPDIGEELLSEDIINQVLEEAPVLPLQFNIMDDNEDKSTIMPLTISPTKRFLGAEGAPHESPDMKFARNRLGTLLTSIRNGDKQPHFPDGKKREEDDEKRGPGRPKKSKKERRVVFELRGKPFGLRDIGSEEAVYALCRNWMKGRDDNEREEVEMEKQPPPQEHSLDLLATKDILALPRPLSQPEKDPPGRSKRLDEKIDMANEENTIAQYLEHWKNVKNDWRQYARERSQRHYKSIQLLETVFGIAQQNQNF